jgi:orotate phosphoribosyltransferase
MNYRNVSDLEACITRNLWKIPANTDVIVGVPRSGFLAATMLALHLNLPLTDVEGFLDGRLMSSGRRLGSDGASSIASARTIAVVDDSISSGREMCQTREKIGSAGLGSNVIYVAVYAAKAAVREVDIYFELCPLPRVFAWNLMHRSILDKACVDLDGVLCFDPVAAENDDGPRYLHFLDTATPLLRPTYEIGTIVTCRLEKYRRETVSWLRQHGVKYRELVMWDMPDKQSRVESCGHSIFKASVFRSRPSALLFIESSARQAQDIADLSGKPVICVETQQVCWPGLPSLLKGAVLNSPRWVPKAMQKMWLAVQNKMCRMSRC